MDIPDSLATMFSAKITKRNGSYHLEIPEREISVGELDEGGVYQVAVLHSPNEAADTVRESSSQEPGDRPVEEGDILEVEIEDIGDKGDGIARIGPGYIIFVEGTEIGDRVTVEITSVQENFAFADVKQGRRTEPV